MVETASTMTFIVPPEDTATLKLVELHCTSWDLIELVEWAKEKRIHISLRIKMMVCIAEQRSVEICLDKKGIHSGKPWRSLGTRTLA
jgi:hypothetical protein